MPPAPMEVDQASEHPLPPVVEDIASLVVPLVPPDAGQKLHPNMEYNQVPFPTLVIPLPVPHDSLGDNLWLVNLEVIDISVDNPREIMPLLASSLPTWNK